MVGNPNHDPKTGEFSSGHGATGHNAGGGNRKVAASIKEQHIVQGVNDASVTERYVYASDNNPNDDRWKVWAEAKVAGKPVTFTEDVYNTKKQAVKAMASYAKHQVGWPKGSYYKSINE